MKNFKQLSENQVFSLIEHLGQKPYRTKQIVKWIYRKDAASFEEMTDLPRELRDNLSKTVYVNTLNIDELQTSRDSTRKFLFKLEDGESIESVLMPNSTGKESFTLCISSQAGCAMGCGFCVTGSLGFKRNLYSHEIVDQIITVRRFIRCGTGSEIPSITNIVFMGMGEPLRNIEQVIDALHKMIFFMGFSRRKITVSTSGIIPGIRRLGQEALGVNLAISLNATSDEVRDRLMPVNKKYPLKKLMDACRRFPLPPNRHITFEYILLDGINDSKEDAGRLIKLLRGIRSKINLIPYNPPSPRPATVTASFYECPAESKVLEFQSILVKAGITAIIRKSKGADISAACGQLKALYQ